MYLPPPLVSSSFCTHSGMSMAAKVLLAVVPPLAAFCPVTPTVKMIDNQNTGNDESVFTQKTLILGIMTDYHA